MGFGQGKVVEGGIFTDGNLSVLPCSARTKRPMDKQRPQLDSAHQIGLELILQEFLIVR